MNNNEIKYETRLVAFIDILGFKELIKSSISDLSKLKLLYKSLLFLKSKEKPNEWNLDLIEIEECAQLKNDENFDISKNVSCTCFSDSIIVSVKVEDNLNAFTSTLITNLSLIGAELMKSGILFRGAVTVGELVHQDDGLIFGPALVEAYQLESTITKNPRIILSDKLIRKLNYPLERKVNRYPYHFYVDRFDDGCVGFHQIKYFQVIQNWGKMSNSQLINELREIKSTIIEGLDSSYEHPDIFSKFNWLKKEYNSLYINIGNFEKIYELNENISGQNINYEYTDKFHYRKQNNK